MRKHKKSSLNVAAFQIGKGQIQALKRSQTTNSQKRFDEGTIVWGVSDSLPLEICKAVDESPTTTACIDLKADFIKGQGFKNKALESIIINNQGQTLWELHCQLSEIMALLDGFSVVHKYNRIGQITNVYYIPFECLRFVKPEDDLDPEIRRIKYNPFWGTEEFNKKFTVEYPLFDIDKLPEDFKYYGKEFPGQVYYFGLTSPLYRFYPRPKYWSGEKWIKADGKLQMFHDENLENGFFQSTLINVIGNPSQPSSNPAYQKEVTGTDGVKRKEYTKTVGEEFNEMMSETFSGAKKAGTAMVMWSSNKDQAANIQAFPSNTNSDILSTTFTDIIRGITIATKTPAILANLPQQVSSLGSDGASFQKAVELMQSRTLWQRKQLENYYNNVLLKHLEIDVNGTIEIVNYQPVSTPVEINKDIWDFLNEQEKAEFISKNVQNITLYRAQPVTQPNQLQPNQPTQPTEQPQVNEALKGLKISDINRIASITAKVASGKMTYEQGVIILKGYGLTQEQIDAFIITPEENATNP